MGSNRMKVTSVISYLCCIHLTYGLASVGVRNGRFYSQEDNRTLMFRGINSVIKRFPWYDEKLLDAERQEQLQHWGFNAVRLGMMWSGFEQMAGQVNETYHSIMQDTVQGLAEHGMYAYLDMHQDVLTAKAEYWGIPEWVAAQMDPPEHPYPWPMKDTSGFSTWACGYFSQEISNAFQQLYTKENLKQLFANFWKEVALRYKDTDSILGYELMNEPWTGDVYEDPSLLLPGNAGSKLLEPMWNFAHQAIRSVDDEKLIFWEPVTYSYIEDIQLGAFTEAFIDAYLSTHNITLFYPILERACGPLHDDIKHNEDEDVPTILGDIIQLVKTEKGPKYQYNQIIDAIETG